MWKGNRLPKEYPRPVGPWLVAIGVYVLVAGLIALLAFTLAKARSRSATRPRKERPEIARALSELKRSRDPRPSREFEAFVRDYVRDARVLVCPTVEEEHMRAEYWPAPAGPDAQRSGRAGRASPVDDMTYCYVSGLSQREPYGWVIAFDEEWSHGREGVNVLHIGAHVEWVKDADKPRDMIAMQARAFRSKGRRLSLVRPWWSLGPEPPPFVVPQAQPPEEKERKIPVARIIIGAMCLAGGALWLARIARGWRAETSAGGSAADERERRKDGEKEEADSQQRRPRP